MVVQTAFTGQFHTYQKALAADSHRLSQRATQRRPTARSMGLLGGGGAKNEANESNGAQVDFPKQQEKIFLSAPGWQERCQFTRMSYTVVSTPHGQYVPRIVRGKLGSAINHYQSVLSPRNKPRLSSKSNGAQAFPLCGHMPDHQCSSCRNESLRLDGYYS